MLADGIKERMRAAIFNTAIDPRPGEDWRDALRRQVAVTRPASIFTSAQLEQWRKDAEDHDARQQRFIDWVNRPTAERDSSQPIVRVLDLQPKEGA